MHADLILIILAAAVILAVVYRGLAWVYLPPRNLPGPAGARVTAASEPSGAVMPTAGADGHLYPLEMARAAVGRAGEFRTEDDEWADRLHAINLAVSHKVWSWFQEKMVPISEVTHYEVEALIVQLGVAEWVPDRYRVAA